MQEIVQPFGATKKPPESMLNNFFENCRNLEASAIIAILIYVIEDDAVASLSKLRAFYALEYLIKNRKFFECLKFNLERLKEVDFSAGGEGATNQEAMGKLKQSLVERLGRNFDEPETKNAGFDLSKLESLREKSNAKFFEKMENLKKGKKNDDIFDIDAAPAKPAPKTDDILEMAVSSKASTFHPSSSNHHDDFLSLNPQVPEKKQEVKANQPKKDSADLFDLASTITTPAATSKKDEIVFEKVAPKKDQKDDFFGQFDMGISLKKKEEEVKKVAKDPFDFL